MWGFVKNAFTPRRDHTDCSGCSLCLLVCPAWRNTRDLAHTPHGRAKAMQHGGAVDAAVIESCTLCMACDPVCPEQIDQVEKILGLRRQTPHPGSAALRERMDAEAALPITTKHAPTKLLPDQALLDHPATLARAAALLGMPVAEDAGADIALALEAGVVIPPERMQRFIAAWRGTKKLVVADGLLLKHLRQLQPAMQFISLGEALSSHADVRQRLAATDLYVIEARAYHADYQRLVKHYDRLREARGCAFNLDLQRIAIPATARTLPQRLGLVVHDDEAQAGWLLHGRNISRIVVESQEDRNALAKISTVPVIHLAELTV